MRSFIGIAVLLVAGCAAPPPVVYEKPGATQADFDQVKAQCEYETSAATQATDYSYRTVVGQELDRAMRQRDLFTKCMAARGFTPRR